MGGYGYKTVLACGLLVLSGCKKSYTPSDFMKNDALRSRVLKQCSQPTQAQSKNCQNAYEAQRKIDFAKKTGRTDIK